MVAERLPGLVAITTYNEELIGIDTNMGPHLRAENNNWFKLKNKW